MMTKANPKTLALAFAFLCASCGESKQSLPEDLFEDGWDRASPEQRVEALKAEISDGLSRIEKTQGPAPEEELERVIKMMAALRAELSGDEEGRATYAEFERRLDALTETADRE